MELASKSKEFMAATSKREQLESLLEKAEGSQVASTDLQKQVTRNSDGCNLNIWSIIILGVNDHVVERLVALQR